MHMADALLTPAVGLTMSAVSAGALGFSAYKLRRDQAIERKIPIMAVTGAFVFAAQMINFTIPGTGSSGHIGGGVLLAAMLGGYPSLLAVAAVLIIQCLLFADGGLLALGCNIFNLGVIPSLVVYPLLIKPILGRSASARRITLASVVGAVVALQLGAFSVVAQTSLSGVAQLPFGAFLLLMQPIHLAIGTVEGLVTAAVLGFIWRAQPELLDAAGTGDSPGLLPGKRVLAAIAAAAILAGGLLSIFASQHPDGLEWAIERLTGHAELEPWDQLHEEAAALQEKTALMPDYDYRSARDEPSRTGASMAGIAGGATVFLLAGGAGLVISIARKRRGENH